MSFLLAFSSLVKSHDDLFQEREGFVNIFCFILDDAIRICLMDAFTAGKVNEMQFARPHGVVKFVLNLNLNSEDAM